MSIVLENVSVKELLKWMIEPIEIDEDEYQEWKAEKLRKHDPLLRPNPFEGLFEPRPERNYASGSDFRSYLSCARILHWNVHDPLPRRVYLNRSTFGAVKKHELIQGRLQKRGWYGEFEPKKHLPEYGIDGLGHMDAVSPSETHFLEIKHNRPMDADELQAAWYQYIHAKNPCPVLLYRTRVVIVPDLSRMIQKYIPRVIGVIQHPDVLPPKHPEFPKCKGTCDYGLRCGRKRRVRMHDGIPLEWQEFFKAIGAWKT